MFLKVMWEENITNLPLNDSRRFNMKKIFLMIALAVFISTSTMVAQTLMDYVLAQRGDTLVIKDYADMGNKSNSLYKALVLDTSIVPAGRVYMLKTSGYYPLLNNPTTLRPTVIVGENSTPLVNNHDAGSAPPLICGSAEFIVNTGGITAAHNLTIRNCALVPGANDGSLGWAFAFTAASNLRLVFDNCIMERNRWIFVGVDSPNCDVTFRNCYFLNMTGQPCRRSGGLFDCFANLDTLLVENCTNIVACGSLFRFRSDPVFSHYSPQFKRIIINHNTFINCAGYVFMNPGCQSNMSLTNNIFVNSNVQSFPGLHSIDMGELDPDWLPMGLVNVYPDSADVANNTPRKFLCQNNLAYWDPSLANMDSILDANKVNGVTDWRSQMIIMNARTDSMFKHIGRFNTTPYSFLVTDTWKNEMPAFTDSKDLSTTQLAILKTYALGTVDTAGAALLPAWRLINTSSDKFVYPDWPIPVDLSYSNADLLAGGIGGFPIGDLNWFPARKAEWLAQSDAEYSAIEAALQAGHTTAVKNVEALPAGFALEQNYPNPFNPSTTISFSLPHSANASLRVFDILGREVTTLLNGYTTSGMHEVQFNAANLASGIYFYRLTSGNFTELKKMLLVK
jgi:hypothetical protein